MTGLALAFILVLALAAPAQGATTIGPGVDSEPDESIVCGDSCTVVNRTGPASPVSGVITRWRIRTATFGHRATLRVLQVETFGGATTGIATGAPQVLSEPVNTFNTRLPIVAGQRIGLDLDGNAEIVVDSTERIVRFLEPVPDGQTRDPGLVVESDGTLAIAAEVEPDADGDGFGDETQDGCTTDATRQGSCTDPPGPDQAGPDLTAPTVSASFRRRFALARALRGGRRGPLAGTVRSNEAGTIVAQAEIPGRTARRLGLQRSRTRTAIVARAGARLARAGSARVRFRFTRRAKRRLAGRRRVALTLRITVRDEAGNPSVVTRRVTLRR